MSKTMRAIGLMSGTSMDGIDIAAIETDGADRLTLLASGSQVYDAAFRQRLRQAIAAIQAVTNRNDRPGISGDVEIELTRLHSTAVARFLANNAWMPHDFDVIGFHGQTVLHRPHQHLTMQLGDGQLLADETGIPVVYDLRANDVELGGQGAPLAPVYHRAMAANIAERPIAFLNVGGVANVTWIGTDGTLLAFDTGPGNALIDDWVLNKAAMTCDEDGKLAAAGTVDTAALARMLAHSYFAVRPPKSLDRFDFSYADCSPLSLADGAATLTALTAEAVKRALEHMPQAPKLWLVSGGGRKNCTMMRLLAKAVDATVSPVETAGFDGDDVEAAAWAYLAVRSLCGLEMTYPSTTGVSAAATGGLLCRPAGAGVRQ